MSKALAAEYQAQPWIMEPMALKAFGERIASIPESSQLFSIEVAEKQSQLNVTGSIARIRIDGYLLDKVPGWMKLFGIRATSYEQIAADIAEAVSRKDVSAIELIVDSPGGMVAGVIGASDAIYRARQKKPVTAIVNNLSASGAYWLSSQAQMITASDVNTGIGSIGVYTWYVDWTKAEERMGIKVIVIRSGEHKGMGLDTITENQIAAVQEYIDDTAANFIGQVARGRSADAEKISELATGKLWIAERAKKLGLIDKVNKSVSIKSKSSAADNSGGDFQTNNSEKKEHIMDGQEKTDAQIAANQANLIEREKELINKGSTEAIAAERNRIKGINEEFADDPAFAVKAAAEGWTIEQAKAEYCEVLRGRLKENKQSQNENQNADGSTPLVSGDTDDGAGGDFMAEARAMAAEKKISVTEAMKRLRRSRPALHQAHLAKCETSGKAMYNEIA